MTADSRTTDESKQASSVHKLDPVQSLRQAVNRMFDEFSAQWQAGGALNALELTAAQGGLDGPCVYMPKVDVRESEKEFVVTVEIPGVKPHDVELKISGGHLVVHGDKHVDKEEMESHCYRLERLYGAFERTIPLPAHVDRDAIQATITHGVLRISLPKDKSTTGSIRKIEIVKG